MNPVVNGPLRTLFRNARLLDPDSGLDQPGDLIAEAGRIVDFGPGLIDDTPPPAAVFVDCAGACLAPGLIDIRVHLREPGAEHKENIASASAAATAGGVTAMVCLPNTQPVIDDVSVLEFVARRAREVKRVKVYAYGSITRGTQGREMTEIGLLGENGAVAFTDGERAVADAGVMRRALSYARTFDALIAQHPEEPALVDDGAMNEGEIATRLGLPGIPAAAEVMLLRRDLELVALTGGRYHAAHISTAASVAAIAEAKAQGLDVTCDTAPHYFALNETAVGDYRTFAKVSPPLRGEMDRQAIVAGLGDGTIDVVASDHAPHDQDSKRQPFGQAEFGIVGLETLLPLVLELVHNGQLSLREALKCVTCRPAERLRLPGGRLRKGAPADLVLFDPDRPRRIDVAQFRSKSKNSPFDGRPVQGAVLRTVVDGRTVYEAAPARAAVA